VGILSERGRQKQSFSHAASRARGDLCETPAVFPRRLPNLAEGVDFETLAARKQFVFYFASLAHA